MHSNLKIWWHDIVRWWWLMGGCDRRSQLSQFQPRHIYSVVNLDCVFFWFLFSGKEDQETDVTVKRSVYIFILSFRQCIKWSFGKRRRKWKWGSWPDWGWVFLFLTFTYLLSPLWVTRTEDISNGGSAWMDNLHLSSNYDTQKSFFILHKRKLVLLCRPLLQKKKEVNLLRFPSFTRSPPSHFWEKTRGKVVGKTKERTFVSQIFSLSLPPPILVSSFTFILPAELCSLTSLDSENIQIISVCTYVCICIHWRWFCSAYTYLVPKWKHFVIFLHEIVRNNGISKYPLNRGWLLTRTDDWVGPCQQSSSVQSFHVVACFSFSPSLTDFSLCSRSYSG